MTLHLSVATFFSTKLSFHFLSSLFGVRLLSGIFGKKRTWLRAGISPLLYELRTWTKCQKTRQVF